MIQKPRLGLALIILLGLAVFYWVVHRRQHFQESATQNLPAVQNSETLVDPEMMSQFLALEARQNELDETVWAKELLAEKYEEVFIKLWDDLRAGQDRFGILEGFDFGELVIGTPKTPEQRDWDIQVTHFENPKRRLSPQDWRQLLQGYEAQGYAIDQSEWRQPRFQSDEHGASSMVAITMHIRNVERRERVILKANLRIQWQKETDQRSNPRPQTIEGTEVELLVRKGEPAFENVITKLIRPAENNPFIDPLILYDLDGDGLSEVILGSKNLVYWNRGQGRFEPRRLCTIPPNATFTSIVADFTGDGNADFLCADHTDLLLFRGDNNGQFNTPAIRVWRASEALLNPFVITAGDIDGDGALDVWLAQYKVPYVAGQMPTPYYDANDGFPSYLLMNDGQGRLQDRTEASGLGKKRFRRTYSASLVDLDDDGDLDLLVVSDFAGVDVHYNDGRGHFTDMTAKVLEETHCFGMAHTFGDYNLDGHLDFFVIGMSSSVAQRLDHLELGLDGFGEYQEMRRKMSYGNRLYIASGQAFKQAPFADQTASSGWSWGATSFDFDNDGDLDIYVANGHKSRPSAKDYEPQFWCHDIYLASSNPDPVKDLYFQAAGTKRYGAGESYGGYQKNHFFLSESGKSFFEAGYLMGIALEQDSRNVVSDDLDGDGKIDLLVTTLQEWPQPQQALFVFRNQVPQAANWIGFRLREAGGGYSLLGAKLTLYTAGGQQIRRFVTGDSYRSQHANTAHFGLGKQTSVDRIEVRWPNGKTVSIPHPDLNRYHEIHPK